MFHVGYLKEVLSIMNRTLESLVVALALTSTGCATTTSNSAISTPVSGQTADGKYDSLDNYVNIADIPRIKDANYMIISEATYKTPDNKEITLHSLGTGVLYKDIGTKTYLVTANHVVQNDDVIQDILGREYKKLSEKFYLLDDDQVERVQSFLRKSSGEESSGIFYLGNPSKKMYVSSLKNEEEMKQYIKTSAGLAALIKVVKPQEVKVNAANDDKDLAIISVPKLDHQSLPYSIGNSDELQTQNLVYVVGWPLGLLKNVTRGNVTSVEDSKLVRADTQTRFIFDAAISPGNSGGAIFAVRDGKFELVGLTSAMYLGSNDLDIGVKINSVNEIFKGNSIRCSSGWKCNLSMPYELKL